MNIPQFIQDNLLLCVFTLGLAVVGYMGYHAVRWIVDKCLQTEKIDQVAQKQLSSNPQPLPCKPLHDRVIKLDLTEGQVRTGQGEYIVFHNHTNGEQKEVAREVYEQVYTILNEYAPAAIVNRNSDTAMKECDNRYNIIQSKVKKNRPKFRSSICSTDAV